MANGFYIRGFTDKEIEIYLTPGRAAQHHIFLLNEANGELQVDDRRIELQGNVILLIGAGEIFQLESLSMAEGFELKFEDRFWEKAPQSASNCKSVLFDRAAINHSLQVSEAIYAELTALFKSVLMEFEKASYINKEDALAAYLKIMMIKIANLSHDEQSRQNDYVKQKFQAFSKLVGLHFRAAHEVSFYADRLNLTTRQLTEICKRQTAESAKRFINKELVTEAKRLLQFSSSPVKEIAYSLDFSSAEQFSHFFKKETGVSPQRFRQDR